MGAERERTMGKSKKGLSSFSCPLFGYGTQYPASLCIFCSRARVSFVSFFPIYVPCSPSAAQSPHEGHPSLIMGDETHSHDSASPPHVSGSESEPLPTPLYPYRARSNVEVGRINFLRRLPEHSRIFPPPRSSAAGKKTGQVCETKLGGSGNLAAWCGDRGRGERGRGNRKAQIWGWEEEEEDEGPADPPLPPRKDMARRRRRRKAWPTCSRGWKEGRKEGERCMMLL